MQDRVPIDIACRYRYRLRVSPTNVSVLSCAHVRVCVRVCNCARLCAILRTMSVHVEVYQLIGVPYRIPIFLHGRFLSARLDPILLGGRSRSRNFSLSLSRIEISLLRRLVSRCTSKLVELSWLVSELLEMRHINVKTKMFP